MEHAQAQVQVAPAPVPVAGDATALPGASATPLSATSSFTFASSSSSSSQTPAEPSKMSSSSAYRDLAPAMVESSSPVREERYTMAVLQPSDAPSSSQPFTPPSSPPHPSWISPSGSGFLRSASTTADPFSGSAKAPSMAHHPSFSKQFPHVKHPHPSRVSPQKKLAGKKRALEASPQQQSPARMQIGSLSGGDPDASPSRGVLGAATALNAATKGLANRAEVFNAFFHDSDGAATSSDDGGFDFARGTFGRSSSVMGDDDDQTAAGLSGLGLGQSVQLGDIPSSSPQGLRPSAVIGNNARLSSFRRQTSHPYEAFGSLPPPSSPPARQQDPQSSLVGSPGSRAPAVRRARFVGSSPTQLTVQRFTRYPAYDGVSSDAEDMDETLTNNGELYSRPLKPWEKYESLPVNIATEVVHSAVSRAFDTAKPVVDLTGSGLECLPPAIAELGDFVGVAPNPGNSERSKQLFSRTATTDSVRAGSTSGGAGATAAATAAGRTLASPSRSVSHPNPFSGASATQLFLANNSLKVLPSALFAVQNLRVLSLRKNGLTDLPAAIGFLPNLKELNVGDNELKCLPAEIQRLQLSTFTFYPNPFMRPPADARLTPRPLRGLLCYAASPVQDPLPNGNASSRAIATPSEPLPRTSSQSSALQMPDMASYSGSASTSPLPTGSSAPLVATASQESKKRKRVARASLLGKLELYHNGVPTLRDLCTRRLLGPADDEDEEDDEAVLRRKKRRAMLLETFENGTLRQMSQQGMLSEASLRRLESARRSAMKLWNSRPDLAISSPRPMSKSKAAGGGGVDGSRFFSKRTFRTWCSGADVFNTAGPRADEQETVSSSDVVANLTSAGDNARDNPWFNRCPNPAHRHAKLLRDSEAYYPDEGTLDWPTDPYLPEDTAPLYLQACETRIEWVSHIAGVKVAVVPCELPQTPPPASPVVTAGSDMSGDVAEQADETPLGPLAENSGCIPILWRGCRRGCLDFLVA